MKTSIRPIRHPDTGETVFHWEVRQGRQIVAGGYGATAEDARSDASLSVKLSKTEKEL